MTGVDGKEEFVGDGRKSGNIDPGQPVAVVPVLS